MQGYSGGLLNLKQRHIVPVPRPEAPGFPHCAAAAAAAGVVVVEAR